MGQPIRFCINRSMDEVNDIGVIEGMLVYNLKALRLFISPLTLCEHASHKFPVNSWDFAEILYIDGKLLNACSYKVKEAMVHGGV